VFLHESIFLFQTKAYIVLTVKLYIRIYIVLFYGTVYFVIIGVLYTCVCETCVFVLLLIIQRIIFLFCKRI